MNRQQQINHFNATLFMDMIFFNIGILVADTTQKPGPGAHSPEKVKVTKHNPPAFSMDIRHSAAEYLCPLIIEVAD
jgi:hypothetical protein